LQFQSEAYATALEGDLRALAQRARDFASDGYIRAQFDALVQASDDTGPNDRARVADELRAHLRRNKLPIVPAFRNLALVSVSGEELFLAEPGDEAWTRGLGPGAFGDADWYSGLLPPSAPDRPPMLVIATPLMSLDGDRRIGNLLVELHPSVWIASAIGAMRGADSDLSPPTLRLVDSVGRTLDVPRVLLERPTPAITSDLVRSGFGLRVREPTRESAGSSLPTRGVFSARLPLAVNGWSVETELQAQAELAAVSGLQARFLLVGVILSAVTSLLLLFPMRFLARPIAQLRDAARHIREGDFSVRVPVESTDEIGELSRSFNLMAEAVEERAERLQTAASALEHRKDELRRERDRLNAVILSMRDGLIVLDAEGKPEVWNAAAKPLIDILESGGMDLGPHRICQTAAVDAANGRPGETAEPTSKNPCVHCLFEPSAPPRSCLVEAGTSVYEVHSTRLASDATGRSGRVLVARDVTDRVAQDERQIHQERLAVLGEVAAVVAHELNNPLAAINMFAQMIAAKLPEDSDLREDVLVIERNTQTCSRTIRELLDYATGSTPEVGSVDVHATLQDAARFLRAWRERKGTELVLELDAAESIVVGDEVQLRQVFVNLVMNALQAVGEGGRVRVHSWLDERHLVIDVEDDGPGIAADVADSIFKPFFTTKPRGEGTGLGLPTARRITEIQGGGLELLDGRPGHTTFRVRLLRGAA